MPPTSATSAIRIESPRTLLQLVAIPALAAALIAAITLGTPTRADAAGVPVDLGTLEAYSVLGGQAVTNTGPSILSDNVGVSPGTAITGFPPGISLGTIHSADASAAQAQSDLVIAYNDVAGRAPTSSIPTDLVGLTLVDGVYNSTGPVGLSGTLTLDGQGDPNSVFIFQVASTLITASASTVALTNGARSCNVYWQVGSSATLGTASVFTGNILALTSISVTTGTTVAGRALARNGQVSLDTNVFTSDSCDVISPSPSDSTSPSDSASPTDTASPSVSASPSDSVTPTDTASPSDSASPSGSASPSVTESLSPSAEESDEDFDFDLDADDDDDDNNGDSDDDDDDNDDNDDNDNDSGNRHRRGSELASTGAGRLDGSLAGIGGALLILGSGALLLGRRKPAYRPKHR